MNVTDGDRERALLRKMANVISYRTGVRLDTALSLAAEQLLDVSDALAEERERARAPFLALAEELWGMGVVMGSVVAKDIRKAAEETTA